MKVGIVTIPDITNYGNRLQNYAVSWTLREKFGCDAVSLASYRERPFENGRYDVWIKNWIARQLCVAPKLAEKLFSCNLTRWTNFYNWEKRHIPVRNFYGCDRLPEQLNEEYDVFFAGSDQIWNCCLKGMKYDDYFLRFAENRKKAAISASFGIMHLPEEKKQVYKESLSSFAYLSVREDAGAGIIKELTGQDVPVLIDPVMLLSKEAWLRVAKRPRVKRSGPYVLKYYLGEEKDEEKIDRWAKERGYEVYELLNKNIPELYSAGPGEFISLVANASLVASDSFHCIAFAMIFRKPFLVYARHDSEKDMTSRMDTLLNKFGFQSRWKHLLRQDQYLDCDYSRMDGILLAEQNKAVEYIQQVLESAGMVGNHDA